jgi:hypothetical protein
MAVVAVEGEMLPLLQRASPSEYVDGGELVHREDAYNSCDGSLVSISRSKHQQTKNSSSVSNLIETMYHMLIGCQSHFCCEGTKSVMEEGNVHPQRRRTIPNIRRLFWKILLVGSLMTTALVYCGRGRSTIVPSEDEWSLLQQYYGPGVWLWDLPSASNQWSAMMASATTGLVQRLRQAQQLADVAQEELNSDINVDTSLNEDVSVEAKRLDPNLRRKHRILKHEHDDTETSDKMHLHHHDSKVRGALPVGCETTIVLIRHCEKGSVAEHCAFSGYERSVYLSTLFGGANGKYPAPSYIFAEAPVARHSRQKMNFREVETVGPLSVAANVKVDDSYTDETLYDLAHRLKRQIKRGTLCGQVVVIVWKHSRIGELAHWLGCGPHQGCPIDYSGKTFDQLWQIRYIYTNLWNHSTHKNHFIQYPNIPYWNVFGSVQYENFDPLAFSNRYGDAYSQPRDAFESPVAPSLEEPDDMDDYSDIANHGMKNWEDAVVAYPERKFSTDTAGWKMTMVGLSRSSSSMHDVSEVSP